MSQQELLKRVVEALEAGDVAYMITGSFVSSFYGEPRSSHDIDFVVEMTEADVGPLIQRFPSPDYFLQSKAMLDAIRRGAMFNLLEVKTGDKVDFWMAAEQEFDRSRMARRVRKTIAGCDASIPSPEDVILAKLVWTKAYGGSERQFNDALRVFEVQASLLDEQYIESWTTKLDVLELWQRLQSEATDIESDTTAN